MANAEHRCANCFGAVDEQRDDDNGGYAVYCSRKCELEAKAYYAAHPLPEVEAQP